jgi:hypothetical protein
VGKEQRLLQFRPANLLPVLVHNQQLDDISITSRPWAFNRAAIRSNSAYAASTESCVETIVAWRARFWPET